MIYLDYAATSWPKPKEVQHAMCDFMEYLRRQPWSLRAPPVHFRSQDRI